MVERKTRRRMRLPNGFGQITKLKNKRLRKPYRAMITVGKTEEGKPICKLLKPVAYFETYNEAYEALIENQRNPYDVKREITFEELYEKYIETPEYEKLSDSRKRAITAAFKHAESIHDMRFIDIRTRHIKSVVDAETSSPMKNIITGLFNKLFDYAILFELVENNYAKMYKPSIEKSQTTMHSIYKKEEIDIMWNNKDNSVMAFLLIQCYSGWRPGELLNIKKSNIDLDNWIMTGGNKTAAGKNRAVPIHEKIKELVIQEYNRSASDYLFDLSSKKPTPYDTMKSKFNILIKNYKIEKHRLHDGRKTFVTFCKRSNMDEYAIKYIVGHAIPDITEKVYTERELEWLRSEMSKYTLYE